MPKYNFNQPLLLINNKPNTEQMVQNNYGFYMYPIPTIQYANKVLTGNELKLYLAISGQAGKDKTGKPYHWAIKHYCNIANIKSNHYLEHLEGLCKKGFIIHTNFESIEVLYPISECEYISSNGTIISKEDSPKREIEFLKEDEQSPKGNEQDVFGNTYSQFCANNNIDNNINNTNEKDIFRVEVTPLQKELKEIKKEEEKEKKFEKKALIIVKQIGTKFNLMEKVLKQFKELQSKYGNQYIYYALKYKSVESFSMGLGLLFTENYRFEIQSIIMSSEELAEQNYKADFLEETEEEKRELEKEQKIEELSKMSIADLL